MGTGFWDVLRGVGSVMLCLVTDDDDDDDSYSEMTPAKGQPKRAN